MAYLTPATPQANRDAAIRRQLDAFFATLGQGFNAYLERIAKTDQVERLNAKSDAELAAMGLTRERIPHYVFRDLMYL